MNKSKIIYKINKSVKQSLINHDKSLGKIIVIALSGGADSLTMLYSLYSIKKQYDLKLHIAHFNHNQRGKESLNDIKFVNNIAKKLNIPITIGELDKSDIKKLTINENILREFRYKFLNSVAKKIGAKSIALGHNSNDNIETILMNIIRGTGLEGLSGMQTINNQKKTHKSIKIFRPLLSFSHQETINYCLKSGIEYREDSSNYSNCFTRNKIRLDLIPFLEKNFNPAINNSINRLSNIAFTDINYINKKADDIIKNITEIKNQSAYIKKFKFKSLDYAIQRRILIKLITKLTGESSNIYFNHIKPMINLMNAKPGQYLNLKNGWIFYVDYKFAQIYKSNTNQQQLPTIYKKNTIQVPGKTSIKGWIIETEYIKEKDKYIYKEYQNKKLNKIEYTIGLNSFGKNKKLYMRTRIDGDRFQPLGMNNSQKLQDFMTNLKIPKNLRDSIPLIFIEDNIAWIPGYRISELSKTTESTKEQLLIKISRNLG